MEIYAIRSLSFAYPERDSETLTDISLTIKSGEFAVLCGKSGSGKSTLLRHLKPALTPHGKRSGEISFRGGPLDALDARAQAAEIGYVLQHPDNGIVTDKVWHELAFGLESLGCDSRTVRLRVAEMASFFGIGGWFRRNVSELSGGQKQLLNLASIMAMQPSVLLLDEPTSQLDPIAAAEFLGTLGKINRELGTTILLSEHRLEEALSLADRLIAMDEGRIIADAPPREAGTLLRKSGHPLFASMPSPMRIHAGAANDAAQPPLSVKEGRQWLNGFLQKQDGQRRPEAAPAPAPAREGSHPGRGVAIRFKDVWFKYERNGPDILKDMSLEVREGEIHCLAGGNGAGKSTALSLVSGIEKPYRGKVLVGGRDPARMSAAELFVGQLGVLPQNTQLLFVQKTVERDLLDMLSHTGLSAGEKAAKVDAVVRLAELEPLLSRHPYDLSGGEQQRAALAKVLLLEPKILLLDEPTKGLDAHYKEKLAALLKRLRDDGAAILMVSHDIEFCASHGDVCSMLFDGGVMATSTARKFFAGNSFYTTAANRMVRHIWPDGVTTEEVVALCRRREWRSGG